MAATLIRTVLQHFNYPPTIFALYLYVSVHLGGESPDCLVVLVQSLVGESLVVGVVQSLVVEVEVVAVLVLPLMHVLCDVDKLAA